LFINRIKQSTKITAIRKALADGNMEKAANMLGRHFSLSGYVVRGSGRGTGLGFPTANIELTPGQALPADGVYATLTHINGKTYNSMTNMGMCPTFNGGKHTAEVYIMDFNKDLYGQKVAVDFIQRIRDEKRFDSIEGLKKQINEDVIKGNTILNAYSNRV